VSGETGKYTGRLMKKQLPGYYRPTTEDFESLWNNGLIILDTNVLLDLYRISKPSSDLFLGILKKYSRQLWLPNQVESEFHKHRTEVIIEQKESYSELSLFLKRCNSEVSTKLKEYSRHPFIETNKISDPIEKTISSVITDLQTLEIKHPDLISDDPILDEMNIIYKEKIGEGYSKERLQEIYDEGKIRYEKKIPPGFKDQAKSKNHENEEFGDLILWYQIIDKARLSKKPIIFVTSEKKVDWWNIIKGQKIGPKPELIEEIQDKANVQFYMYSSDRFVLFAQERLKQTVNPDTLTELREIRNKEGIAEVIRDEEVRIEADRDSFVIGRSVEIFGYANTNENYVRLFLYGPGEFSEGLEVATPAIDNSNRWRYSWNPGYSIQAGLYSFVVFDSRKSISDEISVKAEKGAVTIVASGAQSYYVGEKIKISGTSTASKSIFLAIRGERASLNIRKLDDPSVISVNNDEQSFVKVNVKSDYTWSYVWDTSEVGKLLRPGIYTIYAIEGPSIPNNFEDKAFGSVSIIIKKPFVSLTISQSTVPQGDRVFFTGVAEGASRQKIQGYSHISATNFVFK
jgi:predicted nucleic acid-binding protein